MAAIGITTAMAIVPPVPRPPPLPPLWSPADRAEGVGDSLDETVTCVVGTTRADVIVDVISTTDVRGASVGFVGDSVIVDC
jgi:hypothetical protein